MYIIETVEWENGCSGPGNSVVLVGPLLDSIRATALSPDAGDTEQQFRFTVIPPPAVCPSSFRQLPSVLRSASWVLGRAVCVVSSDPNNNNNYYYYSGPSQVSVKLCRQAGAIRVAPQRPWALGRDNWYPGTPGTSTAELKGPVSIPADGEVLLEAGRTVMASGNLTQLRS